MERLLLAEELFLLTHDPESGKEKVGTHFPGGYAGGLLLDLAERGAVTTSGDALVPAPAHAPAGTHPLLRAALEEMRKSEKPRPAADWIATLPRALKPLDAAVGQSLVDRGVVTKTRARTLGVVPVDAWPQADPAPLRELHARLRGVLAEGATPDPRTARLIALASPLDLVRTLVAKEDRRSAQARETNRVSKRFAAPTDASGNRTAATHTPTSERPSPGPVRWNPCAA